MSPSQYRYIYAGLGFALIAVIAFGWAFGRSDGSGPSRPDVIEGLSPLPGDQVPRQTPLEVDVPVGYELEMWIDFRGSGGAEANWVKIPASEIVHVPETGVYSWRPGLNRLLESWIPGEQRVRLIWNTTTGIPDPGRYEFSFRVH